MPRSIQKTVFTVATELAAYVISDTFIKKVEEKKHGNVVIKTAE